MPDTKCKITVRQDIGRRRRFCGFGYPLSRARALTLIEIIVSLAIMAIISVVIVPQFVTMRNTWDSKQANAETLQNGRILTDHLNRNLAKAVKITAVSSSDDANGFIQFEDNDGNNLRYDINSTSNYVEFGYLGNLSDLAGTVSQLQFSCYDACNLDTPLSSPIDTNTIRFVEVETTLTNSAPLGQDKTLTAAAYLRTNWDSSSACDSNLVGWWKLDETSGLTAEDSSGNNNDGTLTNMVGNEWTDGAVGGALELDGIDDYILRSSTSSLNLPTAWTISVWVYFVGNPAYEYIVTRNTSATSNMQYGIYVRNPASGGAVGVVLDGSITDIASVSWSMESWTHIAVTWDGSDARAYVDGVFVDSIPYTGTLTNQGDWLNIGRRSNSVDGTSSAGLFDGFVDDVRIYSCALDDNEISALASPGVTYEGFTEAKADSDTTSITIQTPGGSGPGTVAILGSWTTDLTHTAEAGTNRALIFVTQWEDDVAPSLTSVTYGGQTMTKVIDITAGTSGFRNYVAAFILDEADIDAATSDTFVPTWGNTPSSVSYASVFLQNVDQTDIVGATDSASTTTGTNPIETAPLSTEDGDMVILAAVCGNNGSYTLNNGFTEGTDQSVGSNGHTGVTGHKAATGADETPSATHTNANRQGIIGFVVQAAAGEIDSIEGDLLIAAVATDGSETISPPAGEDWTEIDIDDYGNEVTLGVWWKLADASESSSHEFTWTGDEQAYGWMMRFTGHDPTDPIDVNSSYGESSSTPTSPSVTTTVDNCLILRLGAFDDDDITVDDPGLSGHTAITMDESSSSPSAPVAWWKLDETSGTTAADSSGNGYNGTLHSMSSPSCWVAGHIDNALRFDGSNDYVSLPIGSLINSLTNCTIATWVYWRGGTPDYHRIWDFGNNTTVYMYLIPDAGDTGRPRFTITINGSSNDDDTDSSVALPTNAWHHIAVTIDQSNHTYKMYLDGTLRGQNTSARYTPSSLGTTTNNWLGRSQYTQDPYLNASLDDVRIYNRVLETEEIAALVAGSSGGGTVSGGAGYVSQSASGGSGTSTFTLGSSNEAQMLTIAIAPDSDSDSSCEGQIRP